MRKRKDKYGLYVFPLPHDKYPTWMWQVASLDNTVTGVWDGPVLQGTNKRTLYRFATRLWDSSRTQLPQNVRFLWELYNTKTNGRAA